MYRIIRYVLATTRRGLRFLPHWHKTWSRLHTVTVIMQVIEKQEEVSMVILFTFVEYELLGEAKE